MAARAEAAALEAEAEEWAARARVDVQRATNYVLGHRPLRLRPLLRGHELEAGTRRLQLILLSLGIAVFLMGVVWLATLPRSISI